jgi:hypothetical protein
VLVRTATHSLLYDAGPRYSLESDAGHRVLVPLLRAYGERLDTLVLSHRDTDHTGGAPAALAMQPRAELLSSLEATRPLQATLVARRCEAGQAWTWAGVRFEVLHPFGTDYRGFTKPNAVSCVLRIGNGRAAALLAGDIERLQEAALVVRTPQRCVPTCCWRRTMAARLRRARPSSMRCSRASPLSWRGIATASATRHRRWRRAAGTVMCGWSKTPAVAPRTGPVHAPPTWPASASGMRGTGSTVLKS